MIKKYPISIVIPIYKNYESFYEFLEVNKKYFSGCEVIIMNDYPMENITEKIKGIYSDLIVINNKKNLGFAGNVNQGVLKSTRDYVLLMNSDVLLKDDKFKNALEHFKSDNKLFAVGFAQMEKDGKTVGANRGYFKNGLINHSHQSVTDSQDPVQNFWAEGGASLFCRKLFIDLGLLDELFNPFYWEDIDLSYRAWKMGYSIIYDPKIRVEHHHETTIGKYFDKSQILKTAFRNQIIFNWKNLTDGGYIRMHFFNIPKFIFRPGFFQALIRLPGILQSRKKTIRLYIKSDREILDKF